MPQSPFLPAHYELQHCLGEGGFGTVFEAFDSKLRRSVAIKCLKNLADASQSARLVQEAQLAASLQHAAFVKIYTLEESGSTRSIVMELVRGHTLKQLLASTPPDQQQALSITRQIAEAMQEAHASGLVHGDLKPSNVMLQLPHTVRILDFGLATQADNEATSSLQQTDPQGTIAYMAPERLLGQPLRPSSDIYALGVILYELLTGARPYAELNGLALAAAQMQSSSLQWRYPATLAPAVVQLIQGMTAPAPQRLQSMHEVSRQLAAMEGLKTPAVTTVRRLATRWWRPAALSMAALLMLAAGASWLASTSPNLLTSLQTTLRPHSESRELQHALQALAMWDRPGELDEAERRFSTVIQNNPNNGAAVAGMALVYCRRFSTDERDDIWLHKAEAAAQQALHLSPQLALAHVAHADVLGSSEKHQAALEEFDVALGLDPENIFALIGKMDALQRLRRFDDALIMAQQGLQRHPAERLFADQIGAVHYAQAHYAEAEQAFRKSIQIQPDAVFSYANLSAALASQGQQDAALNILQQGLQIRPSAWLYGNLGNILFLRGDYLGAAAAFESAVAPDQGSPNDYLGWANLGDTLLWIPGRMDDARKAYARASELLAPRLTRSPDDVTLLSRMGLYYARSSDKQRSLPLLQRALALSPGTADVQFRAALSYELIGERGQALQAIHQSIKAGYPIKFIEAAPELLALRRDSAYTQLR